MGEPRWVRLKDLLGVPDTQLRVPPYQRPYAWETEQVDELWGDLLEVRPSGRHFMGALVLNCEDRNRPEIVDGQQRVTTLVVLLGLIRDGYAARKPELAGGVQQYLENRHARDPELRFKLRCGDANWDVLRDFVLRAPTDPHRRQWQDTAKLPRAERVRNAALIDNAARLRLKLDERLASCADAGAQAVELERLEAIVVSQLEFVAIEVAGLADAFVIFETLNDRGLDLSAGDLLKNHLLANAARAGESVDDLAEDWDELLDALSGADVTRFLRHYLLIQHARVQKDDVFRLFKGEVERRGARALLVELLEMAQLYGQFVDPTAADPPSTRRVLRDLATLRATMCYTALLPARRYLAVEDFIAFARLAEILTFRYSTICSKDSKELERCYHRAAKLLTESKGKELQPARQELVAMMPTTREFEVAFEHQSMGKRYLVNYVLRRLEESLDTEEKRTRDSGAVHIEHVMPQTLNDDWRKELGERVGDHAAFVNRWGNLTLLGGRRNIKASNLAFGKKRVHYRGSNILLTRQLADVDAWGLDAISARQRDLAHMAEAIWRPS